MCDATGRRETKASANARYHESQIQSPEILFKIKYRVVATPAYCEERLEQQGDCAESAEFMRSKIAPERHRFTRCMTNQHAYLDFRPFLSQMLDD